MFSVTLRITVVLLLSLSVCAAQDSHTQAVNIIKAAVTASGIDASVPFPSFTASGQITYNWADSAVNGTANIASAGNTQFRSSSWNGLTNPTGNLALTTAAYTSLFTYNGTTGSSDLFKLTDTASNTGTGILLHPTTASSSTATPFQADANGAGVILNTSGVLKKVGSGHNDADQVNDMAVATSATVAATEPSGHIIAATYQGNGSKVQLSTGSPTSGDCAKFAANANTVAYGSPCSSGILQITLGSLQGTGGCSISGSYLTATAPTAYTITGSTTQPQRCLPQFTVAGALGTGTRIDREIVLPDNYVANATITLNLEVACASGTSSPIVFSARYGDTSLSGQPTFNTSTVTSSNFAGVAFPTTVTGTIAISPTASPTDQFFYTYWLSTDTSNCHPVVSKEYLSY